VAEHDFLVYNSLASADLALSTPNPMMKIADIAGGGEVPYLEAAVGRPLEWDQVVPYFGRREIVKGSVYSYYEFPSSTPLTDLDWAGNSLTPTPILCIHHRRTKRSRARSRSSRIRRGSALSSPGRPCHVRQNRPSSHHRYHIPHCAGGVGATGPRRFRLLFTGDIMMSRLVKAEIDQRKTSPWTGFTGLFGSASLVGGNFEALSATRQNAPRRNKLCFAAPDSAAELMRQAGFRLVTAENNHSGDLGQAGRSETRAAFQQSGLLALDFDSSPQFFRFGELTVGFVAVTTIRPPMAACSKFPLSSWRRSCGWLVSWRTWWLYPSIGATNCRIGRPMRSSSRRAGWSSTERTLSSGIIPMLSRPPHVSRAGQSSSHSATIFSTRSMPRPRTA
jgi:hypothetical protein